MALLKAMKYNNLLGLYEEELAKAVGPVAVLIVGRHLDPTYAQERRRTEAGCTTHQYPPASKCTHISSARRFCTAFSTCFAYLGIPGFTFLQIFLGTWVPVPLCSSLDVQLPPSDRTCVASPQSKDTLSTFSFAFLTR